MKKRILSALLSIVMILGLTPAVFAADAEPAATAGTVQVIVENTTYAGAAAEQRGELFRNTVDLQAGASVLDVLYKAFENSSHVLTVTGGTYGPYVSAVDGLKEKDGGAESGWLSTVNDWFSNEGVSATKVEDGDVVRLMYSLNYGVDLGGDFEGVDTSLEDLEYSANSTLISAKNNSSQVFNPADLQYFLTINSSVKTVILTPSALNKNYQVRIFADGKTYRRGDAVPVTNGTLIRVICGDPSWPSNNSYLTYEATEYEICVHHQGMSMPEYKLDSVRMNKTSLALKTGETAQLTGTPLPANTVYKKVTWTSANPKVATVDANGKVTAKGRGTTAIKATGEKGDVNGVCNVTVTQLATKVTLSKTAAKIKRGKTLKLTANVQPSDTNNPAVKWTSSKDWVAKVSSQGKVKGVSKGTATIMAKATDGSGKKATCKVTVTQPVSKVKLNKDSATLEKGKSLTLKATLTPKNASVKKLKWKSSKPKVAKVAKVTGKNKTTQKAKIVAKKAGTATITAKATDGSKKKATCKITVQ